MMHAKNSATSPCTLGTPRLLVDHGGQRFCVPAPDTEIVGKVAIDPRLQLVVLRRRITGTSPGNCWPDATELKLFALGRDGSWHYINRPTTIPTHLIPALAGILAQIQAAGLLAVARAAATETPRRS